MSLFLLKTATYYTMNFDFLSKLQIFLGSLAVLTLPNLPVHKPKGQCAPKKKRGVKKKALEYESQHSPPLLHDFNSFALKSKTRRSSSLF